MIRKSKLIGVALVSVILAPLAHAGDVQATPPALQRMVVAADEFRSAAQSLSEHPTTNRGHELDVANKALDETQNALAIERLLNASSDLEKSVKTIENSQPGISRGLAIDDADSALHEARRAVDSLKSAANSPRPTSVDRKG